MTEPKRRLTKKDDFIRYHHRSFKGWISVEYKKTDLAAFLHALPGLLREPEKHNLEPIKVTKDRKAYTLETVINGGIKKFHIKHDDFLRWGSLWKVIKYAGKATRGQQAWLAGRACIKNGVITPLPVAYVEKRIGPFLLETIYLTEYVAGRLLVDYYNEHLSKVKASANIKFKHRLIQQLAKVVADMHNAGIHHRDLKHNNIFVICDLPGHENFCLLDLESAEVRGAISITSRLDDLGCLAYSLVRQTRLGERLRFLKHYCELSGIDRKSRRRLVVDVDQWVNRKIDKKIKHDKDWRWARRILVIRNDNIGDVICTTPVLEALRRTYPKAHIAVLVANYTRDAIEGNPFIDRIYSYQKSKHAGFAGKSKVKAWIEQARMIHEIRNKRFDVAIGVRGKFTSALGWLVYASGAPIRVGHRPRPKDQVLSFFINVFVEDETEPMHEVERSLNVVRRIGVDVEEKHLCLHVSEADRSTGLEFILRQGLKTGKRLVCLHLTRRMEENRWWSPENYARVAGYLEERTDVDLVLNWLPKDQPLADAVISGLSWKPLAYTALGLKEFAGFVRECDLFITLEGGAMHVAAAVGTPTLAIFGSTSDVTWRPWGERNVTLRGGDHANSVTPDAVIRAADRMLTSAQGSF